MNHRVPTIAKALAVGSLLTTLTACSPEELNPKGQAVVRVNGDEITIHQINYALTRLPNEEAPGEDVMRRVAEQYIDQQLLLQKALQNELQREVSVMQVLEETRRQLLAQAYLERALGYVPPPSASEVSAYYRAHPELFAERKIYEYEQLIVDKALPQSELDEKLRGTSELRKLVPWLESKRALVKMQEEIAPAEKIPMEILPKLHALKTGERLIWDKPEGRAVLTVKHTQIRPLAEKQAKQPIENYLVAQKRQALSNQMLQQLRQQARIQWREDFQKPSVDSVSTAGEYLRNRTGTSGEAQK